MIHHLTYEIVKIALKPPNRQKRILARQRAPWKPSTPSYARFDPENDCALGFYLLFNGRRGQNHPKLRFLERLIFVDFRIGVFVKGRTPLQAARRCVGHPEMRRFRDFETET